MQEPLEIVFHQLEPSEALKEDIRERAEKLTRLYDRITHCRVSVEALHHQHATGNVYECHITLLVPGAEIAVSRQPKKAKERYANADVHTSIRDAFKAAERQLKDYRRQLQGEVKSHDMPFQGQIAELDPAGTFGFILTNTGARLYFHQNSLLDGDFAALKPGDPVRYVEASGDTGPTASKVWLAAGGGASNED
jgi:ribosome-associated translation inhibitor RaiA/cold shock CspA family protein